MKNQIHRVVRKNGHGVSLCVLQECQKNPEEMDNVRGKIGLHLLKVIHLILLYTASLFTIPGIFISFETEIKRVQKECFVFTKFEQKNGITDSSLAQKLYLTTTMA